MGTHRPNPRVFSNKPGSGLAITLNLSILSTLILSTRQVQFRLIYNVREFSIITDLYTSCYYTIST